MRKILFAALLCASALALSPAARAAGLSRTQGASPMLIPTTVTGTVSVTPVRYYRHRHWRRHHWHRHYR